jgi:hypothetical protein
MNQKGFMFKKNSEYRPGSLGGSVKLVLTAFMALALMSFVASSAMAELKIDGQFSAAFGQYNAEDKEGDPTAAATTTAAGFRSDSQAQLNFTGSGDMGSAKVRLRVRENANTLAAYRHHIYWNASEQLKVGWWGVGFGLGAALVGYGVNGGIGTMGDGTPIGDNWGGVSTFANARGIDISFTTGGINAGVAILDHCVPSCTFYDGTKTTKTTTTTDDAGDTTTTSTTTVNADQGAKQTNAMTLVPYFKGSFGALTVGAFLTSASADDMSQKTPTGDSDPKPVSASAMDVAVVFNTGGMSIAFEYGSQAVSPNSDLLTARGGPATIGDWETASMGLGVSVAGLKARYSSYVTSNSVGTVELEETTTEIAAAYSIPMGAVTLIPQFAQQNREFTDSSSPTAIDESASTYVALGASASF